MAWATMLEKARYFSPRSLIKKNMSNTTFKHYVAPFKDVSGNMWALLIAYPDTDETKSYPNIKEVRLGVPAVTLTTESDDALAPVVKGRLAFSLLEERADQRYRHLVQAPEGDVSVVLMYLGDEKLPANGTLSDQWMQACIDRFDPTTKDGNCFWCGTLDPESYKEPANQDTGYLVSFEANDFGRLARIPITSKPFEPLIRVQEKMELEGLLRIILYMGIEGWAHERHRLPKRPGGVLLGIRKNVVFAMSRYDAEDEVLNGDAISRRERGLIVDTSQFFEDSDTPMSLLEVLERVLSSLSLRIEQSSGMYIVSDISSLEQGNTTPAATLNNKDAQLSFTPVQMKVLGDDGELSLHESYGKLVVTTYTHLDSVRKGMELPKIEDYAPWVAVGRADVSSKNILGWRFRTTDPLMGTAKTPAILEVEAETLGEDGRFYSLVWNPKSIHGRVKSLKFGAGLSPRVTEYSVFYARVDGWKRVRDGVYANQALKLVDEDCVIYDNGADLNELTYDLTKSFNNYAAQEEGAIRGYVQMLKWYRDQMNSTERPLGLKLNEKTPWTMEIPNIGDISNFCLRLDMPLLLSFGSDLYQEMNEVTGERLKMYSNNSSGRNYNFGDPEGTKRINDSAKANKEFTDQLIEARVPFSMTASNSSGEKMYLIYNQYSQTGELFWSPSTAGSTRSVPFLSYGGDKSKLNWGSITHARRNIGDQQGDGVFIPLPPRGFTHLELEVFSVPTFYKKKGDNIEQFTEWKLWSVPSAVLAQAPSMWISDYLGRTGDDIAKNRRERFTFSDSTTESFDDELHFSAGYGVPSASPSILRYLGDGKSLAEVFGANRMASDDYLLSAYRARCFGRVYGALPTRGYALSGTFAWCKYPLHRLYAGFEWIAISREIDIVQGTERGTYHQLRPKYEVTPRMLRPELLSGEKDVKYVDYAGSAWKIIRDHTPRRGR